MSYRDSNGNITINEVEANYDIDRIRRAIEYLNESKKALKGLINSASYMKGRTADAIVLKAKALVAEIDNLVARLNNDINIIKAAVVKYQNIDRALAAARANEYVGGGGGHSSSGGGLGSFGGGSKGGGGSR